MTVISEHVCKDVKKHAAHRASEERATSIEFKLKHCGLNRVGSGLFRQHSIDLIAAFSWDAQTGVHVGLD